ncbi:Rrf2 family transcriptional regulator [Halorubrum luteum]
MSSLQLSPSQKRILSSLVNLAEQGEPVVQSKEIAAEIDRNPGTIRNQMQTLRALQLVEGVPGPKGGYKPTVEAYETLDIERMEDPARVPVEQDGESVTGVNVEEIDLTTVLDPDRCRAEIVMQGSVREFDAGDEIEVGPTPNAGLRVEGVVDAVNVVENTIVVAIRDMSTPEVNGSGTTAAAD